MRTPSVSIQPVRTALLAALAIGLTGACSSTGPSAEASQAPHSQAVRIGQAVQPNSGALSISLLSVDQDSRCPRSVACVRMGDADVTLGYRLGNAPAIPFRLRWGAPPSDTTIAGVRVSLDSLTPWPEVPDVPISADQYVAWLTLKPVR